MCCSFPDDVFWWSSLFGVIQAHLIERPLKEIYYYCQLSQGAFTVWLAVHNIYNSLLLNLYH